MKLGFSVEQDNFPQIIVPLFFACHQVLWTTEFQIGARSGYCNVT